MFQLFKLETETPCLAAIWDKVSPDFTVYVVELPPDEFELPEEELPLDPDELDPLELPLLTVNLSPGWIRLELKLFQFIRFDTDTLCLEAMPLSVSPLFTVYVDCEFDDEDELELELDELLELLELLLVLRT
ncbi:hypothetical protein GCM10028868_31790 [Virgibacillus kimchii]